MKIRNIICAMVLASLSLCLFSCGGSGSGGGTANNDTNDYGGYSKEYWDAARDAWDANT